jgi:hypothetical protein
MSGAAATVTEESRDSKSKLALVQKEVPHADKRHLLYVLSRRRAARAVDVAMRAMFVQHTMPRAPGRPPRAKIAST